MPRRSSNSNSVTAYVDGACRGNGGGYDNRAAGYGVYYGDGDSRNVSAPMNEPASLVTNNRAELQAAVTALEQTRGYDRVEIRTDSTYVANSGNRWVDNWQANNWTKSDGGAVQNRDLMERMYDAKHDGRSVEFVHVPRSENTAADRLANRGADRY